MGPFSKDVWRLVLALAVTDARDLARLRRVSHGMKKLIDEYPPFCKLWRRRIIKCDTFDQIRRHVSIGNGSNYLKDLPDLCDWLRILIAQCAVTFTSDESSLTIFFSVTELDSVDELIDAKPERVSHLVIHAPSLWPGCFYPEHDNEHTGKRSDTSVGCQFFCEYSFWAEYMMVYTIDCGVSKRRRI